jgi:hypothetical protein
MTKRAVDEMTREQNTALKTAMKAVNIIPRENRGPYGNAEIAINRTRCRSNTKTEKQIGLNDEVKM